jgi:broad specificity phosphatase PhoE
MTSHFIFVRHGQSQANADGIIADGTAPLTDNGVEQARKTGLEIKDLGITTIVCSPYLRAQQTAETIAGELGINLAHIKIIEELHERGLGDCEGKPKTQSSEWYSQSDDLTLEPRQVLLDRMHKALEKIREVDDTGLVLVIGHAISGFFLFEAAKGIKTLADMGGDNQIGNADFVKVEVTQLEI